MKKICITGIAGFIGSTLARCLVEDGHTVTGFDNLAWGYKDDIPQDCRWASLDILHLDTWLRGACEASPAYDILRDVDLMIHCAANLEVMLSLENPLSDLRVNTEGTIQVLEAMKKWGIKNLINFSSACVYGRGALILTPTQEDDVRLADPHWPYGASKLAAEIYCNLYVQQGLIDNVIHFRPGIVCGPREWYGRALTIFLRRAMERKPIVVFTDPGTMLMGKALGIDGTPMRDFVHIDDVVAQVRAALKSDLKAFYGAQTYNMGTERPLSILQVAKMVRDAIGGEIKLEQVRPGQISKWVKGRVRIPHEMQGMLLSMSKAKTDLGHVPTRDMDKIIEDEIKWLKGGGLERWQQADMKV